MLDFRASLPALPFHQTGHKSDCESDVIAVVHRPRMRPATASSKPCLTRDGSGTAKGSAENRPVRLHTLEMDTLRGHRTQAAHARLPGLRFKVATRGTMTSCGNLATRTALTAALAASVVAILPSARAGGMQKRRRPLGPAGGHGLPMPTTSICSGSSTNFAATCWTSASSGSARSWKPTPWSLSFSAS